MLEGDKYTRILPEDCISHLQPQSGKSNVIKATYDTNNKIVNWVKQGVLRCDDLEDRSEVLKFFVHTAEVKLPPQYGSVVHIV
jgi:son of sevenless-like protein